MGKSITSTMLASAIGFAWDIIKAGERIVAFSVRLGADEAYDLRAGFVELSMWRVGNATVTAGERLERSVNWFAMKKLGYADGEVSEMVARKLQQSHELRVSPIVGPMNA